jgi:Sigma-70, region 4
MRPWFDASEVERQALLHEEINRLPRVYRTAIILCVVQSHQIDQVARDLGWTVRRLERRLARARERLRLRLARHYYGIPANGWESGVLPELGAEVPSSLIESTVAAVTRGLIELGDASSGERDGRLYGTDYRQSGHDLSRDAERHPHVGH